MQYFWFLVVASFISRAAKAQRDDDRFMFDEQENDPYAARAERDLAPYAAPPQQENEPYMAPSEVACYECDSTVDGAMCYDSTLITKESRMCGLNSTSGGACAIIRVESSQDLLTNSQPRSIQRKCMDRCVPGCTPDGDGMQKCTVCCNTTFCNLSNASTLAARFEPILLFLMISIASLWSLLQD